MHHVECVVIGAGQAGLAMSRCLTDRGVDHLVLERGRVAERWRSERWNSLRLLTPNWQSRLPGFRYDGPDPDGYMTMPEVVAYFERYAASFAAPVRSGIEVRAITRVDDEFRVETTGGDWMATTVVVATGYADRPAVPGVAARMPHGIGHLVPTDYRMPEQLPEGGVLVVGASASGIQLADELNRAGRDVTIAVGHHTRLPRRYRGRDILWWLDRMGVFDETVDQVYDVEISREQPSLQLVGHPDHVTIDLSMLQARGVRVVGRFVDVQGGVARFADDLVATTAAADIKLASLLHRIDTFVRVQGLEADCRRELRAPLSEIRERRDGDRPHASGHPHRALGDGIPAPVPVAEAARIRRARRDSPQWRRHASERALRDWPSFPAAPQLELHRRRRCRRDGVERTPG